MIWRVPLRWASRAHGLRRLSTSSSSSSKPLLANRLGLHEAEALLAAYRSEASVASTPTLPALANLNSRVQRELHLHALHDRLRQAAESSRNEVARWYTSCCASLHLHRSEVQIQKQQTVTVETIKKVFSLKLTHPPFIEEVQGLLPLKSTSTLTASFPTSLLLDFSWSNEFHLMGMTMGNNSFRCLLRVSLLEMAASSSSPSSISDAAPLLDSNECTADLNRPLWDLVQRALLHIALPQSESDSSSPPLKEEAKLQVAWLFNLLLTHPSDLAFDHVGHGLAGTDASSN